MPINPLEDHVTKAKRIYEKGTAESSPLSYIGEERLKNRVQWEHIKQTRAEEGTRPARLEVVIAVKLRRMRNRRDLAALLALGLDEVGDELLGEHAARGQVVVVGLQCVKRSLQRGG